METNFAQRTRLVKLYYRPVGSDPLVDANFWEMHAAMAEQRGNLASAITMYQWVLLLDPGTMRQNNVPKHIKRIENKLKQQ